MSCYEWENGTFKLSVKEYRKFRTEFLRRWNESMDKAYARACKIHSEVLHENKGKRNVRWWDVVRDHRLYLGGYGVVGYQSSASTLELDHHQLIVKSLGFKFDGEGKRPCKPKKKDFPHATRKTTAFSDGWNDGEVTFHDDRRVIGWHVGENNHACENARASFLGRLFFELLGKVEWTRGTGGEIIGNDEYNRDSYDAGGGGNYTKGTWGPKEQKARRAAEARARYGSIPVGFHW
jgi:hypothetical protein